jgi:hypothetical protein
MLAFHTSRQVGFVLGANDRPTFHRPSFADHQKPLPFFWGARRLNNYFKLGWINSRHSRKMPRDHLRCLIDLV